MKNKQNKKRGNISRAEKPKRVDLFDDVELTTSPFHKMKTGSYLNKKGEWKGYAIFRKKTTDELFNEGGISCGSNKKSFEGKIGKNLSESIRKITCVIPETSSKFKVIINDDYTKLIMGDKARGSWNLLFMVAQKEMATSYRGEHKNSVDYFNTNAKNRIYTQTGYKLTKILKMEGGCIVPEDGIEINIISEKAFERRRKKH